MAKKMKPGQKRCPSCGAAVSGPRTKTCPKCGHEFKGKPQKGPAPKAAPAVAAAKSTKNGGNATPDKPQVNKTQAVRDYLKDHPGAINKEVAAALTKQGITITPAHVAAIKTKINASRTAKMAVRKPVAPAAPAALVAAAPAAPAAVAKPATNGGTITLEQIKKVAQTVETLGGLPRVTEVLAVIKELGGVKKFRDLADAMSVTGTEGTTVTSTDEVPF